MAKRFFTGILLIMFAGSALAQEFTFPDMPGYKKNTEFQVFRPDNLWDFINGAAEAYLSYGFVDLHIAEYKKGKNVIKLEIYRQSDHTMAFGIYSSERSPSFRYTKLGAQGYNTGGSINFFKGNYYVKLRTYSKSEKTQQDELTLSKRVDEILEGSTEMPSVLSLFPAAGKKVNAEMYINESVLGHKFLNQAFKADYESGPDNFSVFIFDCKSPEDAGKSADAYLTSAGMEPLESASGKYVVADGYNGTVFLAWKDNRMVVISGLSKDQAKIADQYTSEILK